MLEKTARDLKITTTKLLQGFKKFVTRLLFPLYLFPIKFVTYTIYYLVSFLFHLILAFLGLIVDCFVYPFKSFKNFLKSIFILALVLYLVASLFVISDYLTKQYGWWGKFFCSGGVKEKLQSSVVRVVGGYSEGSGFFIAEDQVLTNFHVIADEPSPKIIFPDGSFVTPVKILGNQEADLAVLFTENRYPDKVLPLPDKVTLNEDEPLTAAGYPLGTDLAGKATAIKGNFIAFRTSKKDPMVYIQTNLSLVPGMSGGPLADQCADVVGINTTSLAGLSLFIAADQAKDIVPYFTDQEITKIEVDPSISPAEAVKAFYTYLKARRMKEGFFLLSEEYLKKTSFEEWTNRFTNVLDVNIFLVEPFENTKNKVFVKFGTKNWVDGETEIHYYEGTWQTVKEDGVYKMYKSLILEVTNPGWEWFY